MHWGEQKWQEMQYTGLTFTVDEKGRRPGIEWAAVKP